MANGAINAKLRLSGFCCGSSKGGSSSSSSSCLPTIIPACLFHALQFGNAGPRGRALESTTATGLSAAGMAGPTIRRTGRPRKRRQLGNMAGPMTGQAEQTALPVEPLPGATPRKRSCSPFRRPSNSLAAIISWCSSSRIYCQNR